MGGGRSSQKIKKDCSVINYLNDMPVGKFDWGLLVLMMIFMYFTLYYEDIIIIYKHSLTWLDSLFHMDLNNFYANTLANSYNGVGAVYYWTVYMVIGIWNLPIFVLNKLFGINMFTAKAFLWCKLEIVFFLLLSAWMIGKILKDFDYSKEKIKFAQFMFLSSLMVLLPTMAIAQVDIITTFLMLWGMREYLKTDVVSVKFLLIFSFAASLKVFALFLFLPLVFLKEKRILYVIKDMIIGLVFSMLCILPYSWRTDYHESSDFLTEIMTKRLFSVVFPGGNSQIPAFISILIAICIFAYALEIQGKNKYFQYVVWIGAVVFSDFFIFVFAHPYWIVLLAPYVVILMMQNPTGTKVNTILEFCFSAAITVYYAANFGVYITENSLSYLVLARLGLKSNETGFGSFGEWFKQSFFANYLSVLFGIFSVCLIAFLIYNFPGLPKNKITEKELNAEKIKFDHGMIYLRLFMIAMFIFLNIYFMYFG